MIHTGVLYRLSLQHRPELWNWAVQIRGGQKNEKLAKINEKFQDGHFLIEVTPLMNVYL